MCVGGGGVFFMEGSVFAHAKTTRTVFGVINEGNQRGVVFTWESVSRYTRERLTRDRRQKTDGSRFDTGDGLIYNCMTQVIIPMSPPCHRV